MAEQYNNPTTKPKEGEVVKLLISCPKKGRDWQQTTTGYWSNGTWTINQYKGECYSVIGWADLNSNTENYGTETI